MAVVEFKGNKFEVDEDGFLQSLIRGTMTGRVREGIGRHFRDHGRALKVINAPDYSARTVSTPMVRILSKVTGYKLKYIYELFPSGPGKGACKMAGLAKPTGCV
jgi:tRNA 2-thiouridine synthesizing protein E